jgi:DNA-binding CsgD family transcriptional regulator
MSLTEVPLKNGLYTAEQVRNLLQLSRGLQGTASLVSRVQRVLEALCDLTGAVVGYSTLLNDQMEPADDFVVVRMEGAPLPESAVRHNSDPAALFGTNNPAYMPFVQAFAGRLMEATAISRPQLVQDHTWYDSEFFNRHCRLSGLDDLLISAVPLPDNVPFLSAVCLLRPGFAGNTAVQFADIGRRASGPEAREWDAEPCFSSAHCELTQLIHSELRWAWLSNPVVPPRWLEPEPVRPQVEVAPRLRRVLVRMLAGDSEKQIANSLGLSRHTIHEYVRALYRTLEVSSRSELMAKFVSAERVGSC